MVKTDNITKVGTWLPVFPGFYGTIFEADEEGEIYNINEVREDKKWKPIGYDDCKWDYKTYNDDIVSSCTSYIEGVLKELGMVTEIEFEKISSPRFYNFTNDAGHIKITLSDKNKDTIEKYIKDNIDKFEENIADRYTSCDGFSSSYSNQLEDWMLDFKEEILEHEHKLGSVLDFIVKNEDDDAEMSMYSDCETYIYATNYTELCENEEINDDK